jgi:acetylornithine aminotransferase/acetylornithine/N-succinyldiaminopimelate aminotransferase
MLSDNFLESVRQKGAYFAKKLQVISENFTDLATGVRGNGLLLGLILTDKGIENGAKIVQTLFQKGALINFAGGKVLRFIPPLIVSTAEIDLLIDKLTETLQEISSR